MLEALQFVQGAVTKKNLVPALTHFCIQGGRIIGSNGMLTLSSPIGLDIDITPKADKFLRAVKNCTTTVQLNMSGEKLFIKSGKFKAYIECTEEPFPEIKPEGEVIPMTGGLLEALKSIEKFVGEDDSRRWARGVLFRGQSCFATNNIILVEYWLGFDFPTEICIPDPAIQELLRIGLEPVAIQVSENSMTFHFEGDKWLRAQAYSTDWPPVTKVLDDSMCEVLYDVPDNFFESLQSLRPFVDEVSRVYFKTGSIMTAQTDESGATVDVHVANNGIYNINQLLLLENSVLTINFEQYPKPCPFVGDNIRGIIVGMKS